MGAPAGQEKRCKAYQYGGSKFFPLLTRVNWCRTAGSLRLRRESYFALILELRCVQPCVGTIGRKQFSVRTTLDDAPLFHHQN